MRTPYLPPILLLLAVALGGCSADKPASRAQLEDEAPVGRQLEEPAAAPAEAADPGARDAKEATEEAARRIMDATLSTANLIKSLGRGDDEEAEEAETPTDASTPSADEAPSPDDEVSPQPAN